MSLEDYIYEAISSRSNSGKVESRIRDMKEFSYSKIMKLMRSSRKMHELKEEDAQRIVTGGTGQRALRNIKKEYCYGDGLTSFVNYEDNYGLYIFLITENELYELFYEIDTGSLKNFWRYGFDGSYQTFTDNPEIIARLTECIPIL